MPRKILEPKTKLQKLLIDMGISQTDLFYLIEYKTGKTIGLDRISNIVNGKQKNYNIATAKAIADTIGVTINDIIEL